MAIDRAKVAKNAESYLASGKVGKAIDEFLKLLEDNPKDLNLANRLGDIYLQNNKQTEAQDMFKRAAVGFERDGFANKAIAVYKKAFRLAPDDTDIPSRLAGLYKRSNMIKEAIQLHLALADSYIKKGLTPRALTEFTKIVELEPKNIKNKLMLADLCNKEGQKAQAVDIFLEAAELLVAEHKFAEAGQILQRAKTMATPPRLFLDFSNICAAQFDFDAAKNHLDEGLKANPKNADLIEAKADIEIKNGQPVAALEILASIPQLSGNSLPICEQALKDSLTSGSILNALKTIRGSLVEMAMRGFGDFAKMALYNALETQPIPEYWLLLGEIAHQNGSRDEHVECLKYAMSLLSPGDQRAGGIKQELAGLGLGLKDFASKGPPNIKPQGGGQDQSSGLDPRLSMQVRQLLNEAQQFESSGNPDKAVDAYHRALEIDPGNYMAIVGIADIHKASGMMTKAQAHLTKAAETLAGLGKPELALKCLDGAEELIPGSTRVIRMMLGDALLVQPAVALDVPGSAPIPLELPVPALEGVGIELPALDISPGALPVIGLDEIKPAPPISSIPAAPEPAAPAPRPSDSHDFSIPDFDLPDELEDKQAGTATMPSPADIDESLRQELCSIDFQLDYGSAYDAKVDIERELAKFPKHPELLKRLEIANEKLGVQAATAAKALIPQADPFDLSDILDSTFAAPSEMNDNTRAAEAIQTAEDIFNAFKDEVAQQLGGDDYDTNYNLGIGYREMLLLDPAIDEFKKAMRDPERTLECCAMLAICEEAKGNNEAAMKWLLKGIQDPGFPPMDSIGLRVELANMLGKLGRHQESQVQMQEVEKIFPGYGR